MSSGIAGLIQEFMRSPWMIALGVIILVLIVKRIQSAAEDRKLSGQHLQHKTSHSHNVGPQAEKTSDWTNPAGQAKKGTTVLVILGLILPLAIRMFTRFSSREKKVEYSETDQRESSDRLQDEAGLDRTDWVSFEDEFSTAITEKDYETLYTLTFSGSRILNRDGEWLAIQNSRDLKDLDGVTWVLIRLQLLTDSDPQTISLNGKEVTARMFKLEIKDKPYAVLFYIDPDSGEWGWGGITDLP